MPWWWWWKGVGFLLWVICGFVVVKVGDCRGDGGGHGFRGWGFWGCRGVVAWWKGVGFFLWVMWVHGGEGGGLPW